MTRKSSPRSGRGTLWLILPLVIVAAFGVAIALVFRGTGARSGARKGPEPDMALVMRLNNQGIAYLDHFDFAHAVKQFEIVVAIAPDWLPGKINLGIALLNRADKPFLDRAVALFESVLDEEKRAPDKPREEYKYAHHCLGIIYDYESQTERAREQFEIMTRLDPQDAAAWYYLGKQLIDDDKRATACFERAVELNPNCLTALYALSQRLPFDDPRRAQLMAEHQAYRKDEFVLPDLLGSKSKHTEFGKYALAIGRTERTPVVPTGPLPLFEHAKNFRTNLADGARWATRDDLLKGPHGDLRARLRDRFGGVIVVLDYDRDGRPDLFLLGAVVQGGKVRDLLLHNDGNGIFTDVTNAAGLANSWPSVGCCVADFDNDGLPDLLITGIGEHHLFRNTGKSRFVDVTNETSEGPSHGHGLDKLTGVCLGAAFVDLDQDGDLDLVVCQFAATADDALALLKGEQRKATGGLVVFLNVGEALPAGQTLSAAHAVAVHEFASPVPGMPAALQAATAAAVGASALADLAPVTNPSSDPSPNKPHFRRVQEPAGLVGAAAASVNVAASDVDGDRDVDLVLINDRQAPTLILNDRLLRFHRQALPESLVPLGTWNGILTLDVNHDERSDLLFVGPGQRPALLESRPGQAGADIGASYVAGAVDSPPLIQATTVDIDNDSWTDVVGLSEGRKPVLLHNDGGRLVHVKDAFGLDSDWPEDLVAVALADLVGGRHRDLLVWSEKQGLQLYKTSKDNGFNALKLELLGHRRVEPAGYQIRCNADGFGCWVTAQADNLWTGAENTTLSAGLGQSRQPLLLGIRQFEEADFLRVRWPDNCWQAEMNVPANVPRGIHEANRKSTSCPILFTWNGERYVFVTDFLGAGTLGEYQPDGTTNVPRPEESVKIEAGQLKSKNGEYILKLAEPLNEATYLDRLQLVVVDHPPDVQVYPDERFTLEGPPASQDMLALGQPIFPVKARNQRGKDIIATLRHWDRNTANDFRKRAWLGFAEEHWVELDFGDHLAKLKPNEPVVLCLAGWTDYPYPESIWAAHQAEIEVMQPVLERLGSDGRWTKLCDAGFPAGLPRMMTLDVTGKLTGPSCTIRLRTNMQVFWDQIFVASLLDRVPPSARHQSSNFQSTRLQVARAQLLARGNMQEFSPDGKQPTIYDYDRLDAVPVSRLAGQMTRFGDVTELLTATDDRFVIFGPGDELDVRFDARRLPELPAGWKRNFVLRTWGYCKDCSLFTATGDTVEPLPFRAMTKYPYGPNEHYPQDEKHREYLERYQTRGVRK
jgi:hypothetical protein